MSAEFNLVKFPIIFPLIYGLILYQFPSLEIYLIFFTLLLLAETHFGATWPFFINKTNSIYIKKERISLFLIPILIVLFCLVGFFIFKKIFYLIFFISNIYHVTKQSTGICKLYTKGTNELKFQSKFIYLLNFLFFLVGFFRFYYPLIEENNLIFLNIFFILIIIFLLLFFWFTFRTLENCYTFLTGLIIFYPICFVSNPIHAIIMGVTMHYTQYLYLTNKVFLGRYEDKTINLNKKNYFFMIIVYSILMSFLSLTGKSPNEILSTLIIVPITGQMLHFYLDSQLWKFSLDHNRKNVLKYLIK